MDIFQRANGQLVVNEFESFEADHHASHEKNLQADYEIQLYYENILKTIVPSKKSVIVRHAPPSIAYRIRSLLSVYGTM